MTVRVQLFFLKRITYRLPGQQALVQLTRQALPLRAAERRRLRPRPPRQVQPLAPAVLLRDNAASSQASRPGMALDWNCAPPNHQTGANMITGRDTIDCRT